MCMRLPRAKHELSAAFDCPDPAAESYAPFVLDGAGTWLVLSDVHAPYHDRRTLDAAVKHAKRFGRELTGVLLNGDTLDCHDLSDHDKDPGAPRYVEEVRVGAELVKWLRGRFPRVQIVVKEGNHEERLTRYMLNRAPALFGLDAVTMPSLLELDAAGAEWVGDRRVIHMGRLNVVHGHEYRGGGGVHPARWLLMRTGASAMCGHFHRIDHTSVKNIRDRSRAAWSIGCACYLHPRYMRLNQWENGYAVVTVHEDGDFEVDSRRVL
jgi:predicted phosphodiesterase